MKLKQPRISGMTVYNWTTRVFLAGLLFFAVGSNFATNEALAAREPLLIEGTSSLYQRILTRPGAVVQTEADGGTEVETPPVFTVFYVFTRKTAGDDTWVEVGPSKDREPVGWILEAKTVEWRQSLTLAFTNPSGRLPVLFFDDRDSLIDFVEDESLTERAGIAVEEIRTNGASEEAIISIEPEEYIDFNGQFYLLPILSANETFLEVGRQKIIEVASIPLRTEEDDPAPGSGNRANSFNVGVVFVVDTTRSMGPYIDRTRATVERIFTKVRESEVGKLVSFGMVGFRDSTEGIEGIDYVSKVFSPLRRDFDPDAFLLEIDDLQATTSSTRGFTEDGLAGVVSSLEMDAWENYGGRYIIYISDAGLREPPDPLASTGLSVSDVNALARDKIIAIFSMLLETNAGVAYHETARAQFQKLSYWEGLDSPPFYSVPEGNLDDFGPTVDALTERLIGQISTAASGGTALGAAADAEGPGTSGDPQATLLTRADEIGHAMRLAWLGRERGVQAPDVFRGWTTQFAFDDPRRNALDVRILLTRDQLNDLYLAMKIVHESASVSLDQDPAMFFQQLQTVVLRAANDPSTLQGLDPSLSGSSLPNPEEIDNLGDLLDEFIEHLPYQSPLMALSEDTWLSLGPDQREQIYVDVSSKLSFYQLIYEDVDRWIALHSDADDGDKVYPMPLSLLP